MVDFTTLHPFDFDRNLFNFLIYVYDQREITLPKHAASSNVVTGASPTARDGAVSEEKSVIKITKSEKKYGKPASFACMLTYE